MSDEILLSIMIETYNQEAFISETIESIINQNYWFNYEILIGDDCSNDMTPRICDDYAKKNRKIKVLHNLQNLGPMGNYYNLLKLCKGKYIMDCAGDDYWLPGKVEKQIKFMESHPNIGMCYSKARIWSEKKTHLTNNTIGKKQTSFQSFLYGGNSVPALTICIRNSIIKNYLKEIQPERKNWLMEDYPEWLYCSRTSNIYFNSSVTAVYRVFDHSVSHNSDFNKQLLFLKNIEQIKHFFGIFFHEQYEIKDDKRISFDLSYTRLLHKYSKQEYERMKYYYTQLEFHSKREMCKIFFASNKLLFLLFKTILLIFQRI